MFQQQLHSVRDLARYEGYTEVQFNEVSRVIGFVRGEDRVNVYWTTGTVGTCVNHPTKGKTQLFRRNQSLSDLWRIFNKPRVHTGAGYYRRVSSQRPEPSTSSDRSGVWCLLQDNELQREFLKNFDADTELVALGKGYFAVNRDGSSWWWSIPTYLHNKVHGRQSSCPHRAAVDYVALGPNDNYYVAFRDGSRQWVGPASLTDALEGSSTKAVELLAFAPDDGWFVLWEDGSTDWEGLPLALHNQISGRMSSMPAGAPAATIEELAVGPSGEWFVRYADGSTRTGGLSTSMQSTMNKLKSQGHDIASVVFGEDDSWVVRY